VVIDRQSGAAAAAAAAVAAVITSTSAHKTQHLTCIKAGNIFFEIFLL